MMHHVSLRNYQQVPYHCFAHACDVLHTVFRLASLSNGGYWMGDVEQKLGSDSVAVTVFVDKSRHKKP